jgi:DNA repair exonuclease SbcCD nuclease subunit
MAAISSNKKIAIFTDLHLGVHQNSDFWLDVALKWCDWFTAQIDQYNIDTIFFCGDWMHYRDSIEVKTLHYHSAILKKLKKYKIYMIPGNHCCYYKNTSDVHSLSIMKGMDNITIFDTIETIELNDKKFTFCPWGSHIKDIPGSDVILGHFELQNFRMNGFKICEHGDDPEQLLNKSTLIFSGHFHQRDEKHFPNEGTIIYVGNPFQTDFGDAYQTKGFYILDTDTLSYEFIENTKTPKHLKLTLSEIIKKEEPLKFFDENIKSNIIKIIIDKNISTEHIDALIEKVSTYKPADIKIDYDINYSKMIPSNMTQETEIKGLEIDSIVNEFVDSLQIENKKEVISYIIKLYNNLTK